MNTYISFFKDSSGEIRRKSIHMVDNPATLFNLLNGALARPDWQFHCYSVDVDPQHSYTLYRGVFNKENPFVIQDGVLTWWHAHLEQHAKVHFQLHD